MNKPIRKSSHVATHRLLFAMVAIAAIAISAVIVNAQTRFKSSDVVSILTLERYTLNHRGFWHLTSENFTDTLSTSGDYNPILKVNEKNLLLVKQPHSIQAIVLLKDAYRFYKNDKSIPTIKYKDLNEAIFVPSKRLKLEHDSLNEVRRQYLEDSLAHEQYILEQERIQKELLAKQQAAREMAIEDSIYKEESDFNWLDISNYLDSIKKSSSNSGLNCIEEDCSYMHTDPKLFIDNIHNDTILSLNKEEKILSLPIYQYHAYLMPEELKNDKEMARHLRVWRDSLALEGSFSNILEKLTFCNIIFGGEYVKSIKSKAPNGYIEKWSWDNEYGPVTMRITYVNTNAKTIKYIRFYYTVLNDVDDVRGSGSFQGTGPLEEFETATWDFDRSSCYPAGDASRMRITKILITYMNGSQVTIPRSKIVYE